MSTNSMTDLSYSLIEENVGLAVQDLGEFDLRNARVTDVKPASIG